MTSLAVVIPCYRARGYILRVIAGVLSQVDAIYVVDDQCPEGTGDYVASMVSDPKVRVIRSPANEGVGGATMAGYAAAAADGHDILIKMDGDDQMDPAYLAALVAPIIRGHADYTKGNRFFSRRFYDGMPAIRIFGNAVLSFVTKISTGYWDIMDPTNGYTAIHAGVLPLLEIERVAKRYFFETDMLFRLGLIRAVVRDVPVPARYAGEVSSLKIRNALPTFLAAHALRFWKRLIYQYFVRDLNVGSVQLVFALLLLGFGGIFGINEWIAGIRLGRGATSGTVMLSALPVIVGFQLWLAAIMYDVMKTPREPIHPLLVPRLERRRTPVEVSVEQAPSLVPGLAPENVHS
jgi:glycosyltransferase involved in cell wall biosynthesis